MASVVPLALVTVLTAVTFLLVVFLVVASLYGGPGGIGGGTGGGGSSIDPNADPAAVPPGVTNSDAYVYLPVPKGYGAIAIAVSLPASTTVAAENFINGIPNQIVIIDAGRYYFYNNETDKNRVYPSIYILVMQAFLFL